MKKKILLIDDESAFTDVLKLTLEQTGKYEIFTENSSQKAIMSANLYQPQLILLDVIMPYLEGSDVAMALREDQNLRNIPVVFLTATITKDEVASFGGRIGGHPFVAKPSPLKDLIDTIESNISYLSEANQ
jgi:CheY-like chemotaxis protein